MKNLGYFIVGVVATPLYLVLRGIKGVKDLGKLVCEELKLQREMNKERIEAQDEA